MSRGLAFALIGIAWSACSSPGGVHHPLDLAFHRDLAYSDSASFDGGGAVDADVDAATDDSGGGVTFCGSSPLGQAVLAAAQLGATPAADGIDSYYNAFTGGPFLEGHEMMNTLSALIATATQEVLLETYDIDETTWSAWQLWSAFAQLPWYVSVHVLVNPSQHGGGPFGLLPESPANAVKRLSAFFAWLPNVDVHAWQPRNFLGVLHSKLAVVDAARAYVMDNNFQVNFDPTDVVSSAGKSGLGWFQMGTQIEGEIAWELRSEAASAYANAYPAFSLPPSPPIVLSSQCTHAVVLARDANANETSSADRGFVALFHNAQTRIRILTPNINDSGARQAIADATATADVYLVSSDGFNDTTESVPGMGGTNASNFAWLVSNAKNPCRLHLAWFGRPTSSPIVGNGVGANHAKWASADGQVMIHGSQNLDTQSWHESREVSVAIDDAAVTAKYDYLFDTQIWLNSTTYHECP